VRVRCNLEPSRPENKRHLPQQAYQGSRRTYSQLRWRTVATKPDQFNSAAALSDLAAPRGNRLEPLHGDRAGEYSIRINDQYRVCFRWSVSGPFRVEIADYR